MVRPRRPENPLAAILATLRRTYGEPGPPPSRDPYELVLWENVAYLVDDRRRREAFEALRAAVTLTPEAILATPVTRLAVVIAAGGMMPEMRAAKLHECATEARRVGLARLRQAMREDPKAAAKMLRRFPGIGEPGADKLLVLSGTKRCLAPESNGLRVLTRLGFGRDDGSYARTYRSAEAAVAPHLPEDAGGCVFAHALLRRHGQEICRRTPRCEVCPLMDGCAYFVSRSTGAPSARQERRRDARRPRP